MAKINRRNEIKEKEALQLRFQLALSQNTKSVLNWLPKQNVPADANPKLDDQASFLNLPIISNGASLANLEKGDLSTVGEFLNGDTVKSTGENKRDAQTGSKAMTALMNKMRTENRKAIHDRERMEKKGSKRHHLKIMAEMKRGKKEARPEVAEDSDEEESKSAQIRGKNTKGFEFGKKKRPF